MKHILKFYLNLNYKRKMVLTCVLVGLIPLTLLGTFCYSQTVSMLLEKEQDSMSSSVNTAYNSMNHEIQLYEDQISYLTNLETIIHVASDSYDSTIEKFEVLNYTYDVLLSGIYSQHPEISQITLYVDRTDLFHGKRLPARTAQPDLHGIHPEFFRRNRSGIVRTEFLRHLFRRSADILRRLRVRDEMPRCNRERRPDRARIAISIPVDHHRDDHPDPAPVLLRNRPESFLRRSTASGVPPENSRPRRREQQHDNDRSDNRNHKPLPAAPLLRGRSRGHGRNRNPPRRVSPAGRTPR